MRNAKLSLIWKMLLKEDPLALVHFNFKRNHGRKGAQSWTRPSNALAKHPLSRDLEHHWIIYSTRFIYSRVTAI